MAHISRPAQPPRPQQVHALPRHHPSHVAATQCEPRSLLVAGPDEDLAMAQRMGLDVLFLLRRDEGLVELGLSRFGHSTGATPPDRPISG
ncbi:MAG: hypothetical protein V4794_17040 [Pseudomonadota bacterium]